MKNYITAIAALMLLLINPMSAIPQLTDAEINGINELRLEEKVAYDVYFYMYEKYENDVFKDIAVNEKEHMDKIKELIDLYNLNDPISDSPDKKGVYLNKKMQAMYDEMIMSGNYSMADALRAAGRFEEADIQDLKNWITVTSDQAIINVYTILESGSRDHLRALVKLIKDEGISYKPCILSQEEFNSIISADKIIDKSK